MISIGPLIFDSELPTNLFTLDNQIIYVYGVFSTSVNVPEILLLVIKKKVVFCRDYLQFKKWFNM